MYKHEVYDITNGCFVCRKNTWREAYAEAQAYQKRHPYSDLAFYGVYVEA